MARSDARIILAGSGGDPFTAFAQGRESRSRNKLLDVGIKQREQQIEQQGKAFDQQQSDRERQIAAEQSQARGKEFAVNLKQMENLLGARDQQGLVQHLSARKERLMAEGKPTKETDAYIAALNSGRPGEFERLLQNDIIEAEEFGFIPKKEDFTLAEGAERRSADGLLIAANNKQQPGFTIGDTRFDADGRVIASNKTPSPADAFALEDRMRRIKLEDLQGEEGLRKEVNSLLGDFTEISDAYARIKVSVNDPSPAGDLALVFNYMKLLDPRSTVRESEFSAAANAGSIKEAAQNLFGKVFTGEILEFTRDDFATKGAQLFEAARIEAEKTAEAYELIATKAGLSPDNVLANFNVRNTPADAPGGSSSKVKTVGRFQVEEVN